MRFVQFMMRGAWVGTMAVSLFATGSARAEVRVGGVGGGNLASLSTDAKDAKLGTLTRWGVGGALEWDVTPNLALATRPMYVGGGTNIKTMPGLGDVSAQGKGSYARTELGYIELPLLIKYSFATEGARPYLIAGPSLGLLRSAHSVYKLGNAAEQSDDIKKDFKTTDIGLSAGAGVGANIGQAYVFAEGLYGFGLTNINKDKAEGTGRNRGLQVRAGVTVRLGGK
jgi:hypothetical protein